MRRAGLRIGLSLAGLVIGVAAAYLAWCVRDTNDLRAWLATGFHVSAADVRHLHVLPDVFATGMKRIEIWPPPPHQFIVVVVAARPWDSAHVVDISLDGNYPAPLAKGAVLSQPQAVAAARRLWQDLLGVANADVTITKVEERREIFDVEARLARPYPRVLSEVTAEIDQDGTVYSVGSWSPGAPPVPIPP
jgi:hypothetical protein